MLSIIDKIDYAYHLIAMCMSKEPKKNWNAFLKPQDACYNQFCLTD